jgi:hypothetical protein
MMLTLKAVIENFNYLLKESGVTEDSYILLDWHIPAHYDMDNQEFEKAVREIDPQFNVYTPVYEALSDYSDKVSLSDMKTLITLADALQDHPELSSISRAIRKVI